MSIVKVDLPKGAGSIDIDTDRLSDEIKGRALEHGLRQKIADIAAGVFVKGTMKRDPKPEDTILEDADALTAYLREHAAKMRDAWYAGAWAVARTGLPRDPVLVEIFSTIFAALSVPAKDMPKWRAAGIREAVLALAEAKAGKKVPKSKADATFEHVYNQLKVKAEAAIAARSAAADIDLSI